MITSFSRALLVTVIIFIVGSLPAHAATNVDVTVPGASVQTNSDGSADVNVTGVGQVHTSATAGTNVVVPGTTVKTNSTGTTVKTSHTSVTTSPAGTTVVTPHTTVITTPTALMASTSSVQLTTSTGTAVDLHTGLSAVANQVLNPASVQTIVSFSGDVSSYIKTEDDVAAYGKVIVENIPQVTGIETNKNTVSIAYVQAGKLFGFVTLNMNALANVDATGNVSIVLPWYSFLVSKDTSSIKTSIAHSLTEAKTQNQITISSEKSLLPVEQAQVVHIVADVLSNNTAVKVGGGNVSVKTGNTSVEVKDGSVKIGTN